MSKNLWECCIPFPTETTLSDQEGLFWSVSIVDAARGHGLGTAECLDGLHASPAGTDDKLQTERRGLFAWLYE